MLKTSSSAKHLDPSYLFPNVLFPTPVGPNRTILGWGRVSIVHPHLTFSSPSVPTDSENLPNPLIHFINTRYTI